MTVHLYCTNSWSKLVLAAIPPTFLLAGLTSLQVHSRWESHRTPALLRRNRVWVWRQCFAREIRQYLGHMFECGLDVCLFIYVCWLVVVCLFVYISILLNSCTCICKNLQICNIYHPCLSLLPSVYCSIFAKNWSNQTCSMMGGGMCRFTNLTFFISLPSKNKLTMHDQECIKKQKEQS